MVLVSKGGVDGTGALGERLAASAVALVAEVAIVLDDQLVGREFYVDIGGMGMATDIGNRLLEHAVKLKGHMGSHYHAGGAAEGGTGNGLQK